MERTPEQTLEVLLDQTKSFDTPEKFDNPLNDWTNSNLKIQVNEQPLAENHQFKITQGSHLRGSPLATKTMEMENDSARSTAKEMKESADQKITSLSAE